MSDRNLCPGSNGRPAELVILDVGPWDPPGTCPVCHRSFGMKGWTIPEHPAEGRAT